MFGRQTIGLTFHFTGAWAIERGYKGDARFAGLESKGVLGDGRRGVIG